MTGVHVAAAAQASAVQGAAGAPQLFGSQADFGRAQGWGKSYVTKLKHEGRLVLTPDGQVDFAASLARIQATTGAPERASPPAVSSSARSDRDRQAFYDAEKSRIDLEERLGKLMDRDEMLGALADAAVTLRASLESWPERLSSPLAALEGDEQRIRAFLADHVESALADLSTRFAAMSASAREAAGGG